MRTKHPEKHLLKTATKEFIELFNILRFRVRRCCIFSTVELRRHTQRSSHIDMKWPRATKPYSSRTRTDRSRS